MILTYPYVRGKNRPCTYATLFLRNRSLLFSETFHDIKVPQGLESDEALFFGKILVSMETGPKGQFWAQNDRFLDFLRNRSLLFSETFYNV